MSNNGYEVGYGKPPLNSRFKPGQSPNPRGRPKKPKSWQEISEREGLVRQRVTIGGRQVWLTQREIAVKRLCQEVMKGNIKALQALRTLEGTKTTTSTEGTDPEFRTIVVTIEFDDETPLPPFEELSDFEQQSIERSGHMPAGLGLLPRFNE